MPATARKPAKAKKLSRLHPPEGMELRQWQAALRRQFAREQRYKIENVGDQQVFSEYAVTNPESKRTYRVVIRGLGAGVNYCSCPDYSVNTLGTCKHIEFTLHRLQRQHRTALQRGFRPTYPEVYLRYGDRRAVVFAPGTNAPDSLARLASRYFEADGVMKPGAFAEFDTFVEAARRVAPDLRIYDDAHAYVADLRDTARRRATLKRKYGAAAAWRDLLKVPLFPYQREGALFAASAGRAIIADEMGLGKTIQGIAAAEILAREGLVERVLIICPASLKYQWPSEIEKFSGRTTTVIEGLTHRRRELYGRESFFKIVNYDVIHRDLELIAAWQPDLVILDEAQRIKNWQTRAAKSVKQIASPFAIVLTGTPLENRLEEVHSITEFVDRHRLGPLFAFKAAHEIHEEDSTKVIGYQDLNRITATLAPILIRRTKQQVLTQLPERMDKNFFVPMTDPQWDYHQENRDIVVKIVKKWRRYKFLSDADQLRLRIALQNMRMSCDSTYLIDKKTRHQTKIDELASVLEETFEQKDAKVVIFSQWVRMNELVEELLEARGWGHVHLNGSVPSKERQELTRALREDPNCRVFLSTDAGGTGLNLQTASCVINMDLPWNPAVLEQRIGRVHRLGQHRPVRVVNFVSEGTIEQGMLTLLAFKKSVFAGVIDGSEDRVFMGDSAMNRFMKTVETATEAMPTQRASTDVPGSIGLESPSVQAADDESERRTSAQSPAPQSHDAPSSTAPLAAGAFLNLAMQAGQWLQGLAQCLGTPRTDGQSSTPPGIMPIRLERDSARGQPELRITIPDEAVLRNWVNRIGEALNSLGGRA